MTDLASGPADATPLADAERQGLILPVLTRLVVIHPFPNGNGRWSRLASDALIVALGGAASAGAELP